MWGLTQNEYGVLSTYVPRFEEMGLNGNERWEVRVDRLKERERERGGGLAGNKDATCHPRLIPFFAAGATHLPGLFHTGGCHAAERASQGRHVADTVRGEGEGEKEGRRKEKNAC